jgi:DNA-binding NarL/FixJ family response regulator
MIDVMLVDDQKPVRMGFALMVAKDPSLRVVLEAGDGQEALDLLAARRAEGEAPPNVVVMDVRMPVMDGIDATVEIKRIYPSIQVLILTTYDQDSYAFGALGAGASGFLLKDVRTSDLCDAIHAVNEGDAILTPRVTGEVIRRGIPKTVGDGEARALRERFSALGDREIQVASLVAEGLSNAEIAERLTIQPDSAKKAVSRVMGKLGVSERVKVAVMWYRAGM